MKKLLPGSFFLLLNGNQLSISCIVQAVATISDDNKLNNIINENSWHLLNN